MAKNKQGDLEHALRKSEQLCRELKEELEARKQAHHEMAGDKLLKMEDVLALLSKSGISIRSDQAVELLNLAVKQEE